MARWELYVTWGLLIIIALGVSGIAKQIENLRADFQDYRDSKEPDRWDENYKEGLD